MARCLMILRQNQGAFHDRNWIPLVESPDSIWVNEWHAGQNILYTILSLKPEGHSGRMIKVKQEGLHWVSLWDHEEIQVTDTGLFYHVDPFRKDDAGTRMVGAVQCIAGFRPLLVWNLGEEALNLSASEGDNILLWQGDPSYANPNRKKILFNREAKVRVPLSEFTHLPEGKTVIQLFKGDELIDERILHTRFAAPVRVNEVKPTRPYAMVPDGMVEVEGGPFLFYRGNEADFIPYPNNYDSLAVEVRDFFMDRYPVTNGQYHEFIRSTQYRPDDTANFLKHWSDGIYPDSLADHPVVWINLEDARAYAGWKHQRLPTEMEWQYAAQGTDGRKWPWGNSFDSTASNHALNHTTAVHAFPRSKSPFGAEDLGR